MKSSNICKFTFAKDASDLKVPCFVLESDPNAMEKKITLASHYVILVLEGKGSFQFDNIQFSFSTGDLIFGFKDESFNTHINEKCRYMYIRFTGNRADELLERFNITPQTRHFKNFDGIIPLWQDSLAAANESTIDLASESILLYTFSRLFKNVTERDNIITKILKLSEEKFTDPDLSLATLSDELGYNAKYISRIFKEKMNLSYSEYLRNLRIKYAVSLFEHGIDSVKSVALLSGFADPLYFSTVFKKSLGISPSDYKNSLENT